MSSFILNLFGRLTLVLICSIRSNTSLRSDRERGELMTAASFPRRVIPMLSPSLARCTNSESFCLASNNPMVRIPPPIHLDYYPRLKKSVGQPAIRASSAGQPFDEDQTP